MSDLAARVELVPFPFLARRAFFRSLLKVLLDEAGAKVDVDLDQG